MDLLLIFLKIVVLLGAEALLSTPIIPPKRGYFSPQGRNAGREARIAGIMRETREKSLPDGRLFSRDGNVLQGIAVYLHHAAAGVGIDPKDEGHDAQDGADQDIGFFLPLDELF